MSSSVVIPDGFTREELVKATEREIAMRERVYPDRVALGKMTRAAADRELARMRCILAILRQLPATPPVQPTLFEKGSRS